LSRNIAEGCNASGRRQTTTPPNRPPIRGLLLAGCLFSLSTAAQADWVHDADASEAVAAANGHRLAVSCSGLGELAIYYAIPAEVVRSEIEELPPVVLMVSRNSSDSFASYNASGIDADTEIRFGFRGPATRDLARQFAAANSIAVGIALRDHGSEFTQYNPATFSATGSSNAIRSLLDACGVD
jgi:hypothetical protein